MTEVAFLGEQFKVADKVGALAVMRFAKIAKAGVDASELDGMVAMYDLLGQLIHPDDWSRFEDFADTQHADGDQLLELVQEVFALIAARPSGRSSDSSDGPRTIEPSSTVVSSSPDTDPSEAVISRLNSAGRPDLALLVRRRQESLTA